MKLIQTKEYLLLIDEEAEIKEENIAIHDFGMGYDLEIPCDKDNLKSNTRKLVVAHYPLTKEAKELDLPLLPNPFREISVEELALKAYSIDSMETLDLPPFENVKNCVEGFIEGYKAAQSKQFSLEDMKKAIEMAKTYKPSKISGSFSSGGLYSEEEIIQLLSTQQLPVSFEPEYEEIPSNLLGVSNHRVWKLKTIINTKGRLELVGNYKY